MEILGIAIAITITGYDQRNISDHETKSTMKSLENQKPNNTDTITENQINSKDFLNLHNYEFNLKKMQRQWP